MMGKCKSIVHINSLSRIHDLRPLKCHNLVWWNYSLKILFFKWRKIYMKNLHTTIKIWFSTDISTFTKSFCRTLASPLWWNDCWLLISIIFFDSWCYKYMKKTSNGYEKILTIIPLIFNCLSVLWCLITTFS